jgi:hypothetical protein
MSTPVLASSPIFLDSPTLASVAYTARRPAYAIALSSLQDLGATSRVLEGPDIPDTQALFPVSFGSL